MMSSAMVAVAKRGGRLWHGLGDWFGQMLTASGGGSLKKMVAGGGCWRQEKMAVGGCCRSSPNNINDEMYRSRGNGDVGERQ